MRRVLVGVLLAGLVAPGVAAGASPSAQVVVMRDSPAVTSQAAALAYSLPIARAAFPGPCVGRESITLDVPLDLGVGADALVSTCAIRMTAISDLYGFCGALVHEEAHLAGLSHEQMTDALRGGRWLPCERPAPCPWGGGVCKKARTVALALPLSYSRVTVQRLRSRSWLLRWYSGREVTYRLLCGLGGVPPERDCSAY